MGYGYLGVATLILWPQPAERLGLERPDGALVQQVEPDSPAERRGSARPATTRSVPGAQSEIPAGGDVIVAVDGRPLTRAGRPRGRDQRSGRRHGGLTRARSESGARWIELRRGRPEVRPWPDVRRAEFRVGCRTRWRPAPATRQPGRLADHSGASRLPRARAPGAVRRVPPHAALPRGGGRPQARDHRGRERLRGRAPPARRREPAQLRLPPATTTGCRWISTGPVAPGGGGRAGAEPRDHRGHRGRVRASAAAELGWSST